MEKMKSASDPEFGERKERIWVVGQYGEMGQVHSAFVSEKAAKNAVAADGAPDVTGLEYAEIFLHRPSLEPVYGGPTLLEALWSEMDRLMENLMTGVENDEDVCGRKGFHGAPEQGYEGSGFGFDEPCEHWDNGDKYRAQELAWVLAIVTDPYEPSVDKIRAKAMERWKAAEADADAQNPDGDR